MKLAVGFSSHSSHSTSWGAPSRNRARIAGCRTATLTVLAAASDDREIVVDGVGVIDDPSSRDRKSHPHHGPRYGDDESVQVYEKAGQAAPASR